MKNKRNQNIVNCYYLIRVIHEIYVFIYLFGKIMSSTVKVHMVDQINIL